MGYIFGSNNYLLLTKSDVLAYENSSTSIFTLAGLDLSNNSQILRKPHILSGWLTSTVNNNWSNDLLLRKCDIYRTVSGKLTAGHYLYETWAIVFAIMIFDDKDNIMTTLRQNYINNNQSSEWQARLQENYISLFKLGQLKIDTTGGIINRSVSYVKYNCVDFKNAGAFEMNFFNMTSSGTNISEWINPVLIGVVLCKGRRTQNSYTIYGNTSFSTFISLTSLLKLDNVSFNNSSIKVFDVSIANSTLSTFIKNLVGNGGTWDGGNSTDGYWDDNSYYFFILKQINLNNTIKITWSST